MRVLNFGSLNIDYVYRVAGIVRPGETISSKSFDTFAGGKGANQSIALAKAGADVSHAGKVGAEGRWLADRLSDSGVDVSNIKVTDDKTGHAIIQVDDSGENAIFLFPGANMRIEQEHINSAVGSMDDGDIVLLQNEINYISYIIETAHAAGMTVCLNPAPFDDSVPDYPLDKVGILVLNETEGRGLTGKNENERILDELKKRYPDCVIVLTLGAAGVLCSSGSETIAVPGEKVKAVDTTAAGDTFIGYFLALHSEGRLLRDCLETACKAAAICVTRRGATDSIPERAEV